MKIGDKVLILDKGFNIPTYTDVFEKLGFKDPSHSRFSRDIIDGDIKVMGVCKDPMNSSRTLVGVTDKSGMEYLFDEKYLKLIENTMRKITDLEKNEFIHCANKEEAEEICKLMHEAGFRWSNGKTYLESNFNNEKSITYSPINQSYSDLEYVLRRGYTVYKAQDFIKNINKKQEKVMSNLKVVKSQVLNVKGQEREVTIVVVIKDNDSVGAGYSVKVPEDKANPELAEKIAFGRAMNLKTNLTPEMVMGLGMSRKYILYAIAENLLKRIEAGTIQIKGIK